LLVFVRVAVWGGLVVPVSWFAKIREPGEMVICGNTPEPVKVTTWGLFVAASVIVTVPFRVPAAVGANLTLNKQLEEAARFPPHVLVWVKSPVMTTPLTAIGMLELLVRLTVLIALVVPTS